MEGVGDRLFVVCFVEADPRHMWDTHFAALGTAIEAAGVGRVLLAAPFIPCVVGTDTHADTLW